MDKENNEATPIGGMIVGAVGCVLLLFVFFTSWTIVSTGERAVILRLGEIDRVLEPGPHFKMPFLENVENMDVRTQKIEVGATAASKDLQNVSTTVAVQYNLLPEEVGDLYAEYKRTYVTRVIDPAIQDAIKASTAKFNAEEIITKRPEVKQIFKDLLGARLLEAHILVTNVDIINFDFSPQFNAAIEAKVQAEQKAYEQENITKQEMEKKKQEILKAEAIAEKTRLEVQALKMGGSVLIEKLRAEAELKRADAQYLASQNWKGILPTHLYGAALPMINLGQ